MPKYDKWDEYMHSQFEEMANMRDAGCYVDVTIICEEKAIKLHKLVLSTCSTYFHKIFSSNPCAHPVIILQDIKFSTLQYIIDFIYLGEISFINEELECVYKAADTLGIKGLAEICEEIILGMLTVDRTEQFKNISPGKCSQDSPQKKRKRIQPSYILSEDTDVKREIISSGSGEDEFNSTQQTRDTSLFPMTVDSDNESLNSIPSSTSKHSPVKKTKITSSEKEFKKKRKPSQRLRYSSLWHHFNKMDGNRGLCKYCKVTISFSGGCTGNLKRHLKKKHPTVQLEGTVLNIPESTSQTSNQVSSPEISQKSISSPSPAPDIKRISSLRLSRFSSDAWYHFIKIEDYAQCRHCQTEIAMPSSSTGNLLRHMKKKHPALLLLREQNNSKDPEEDHHLQPTAITKITVSNEA